MRDWGVTKRVSGAAAALVLIIGGAMPAVAGPFDGIDGRWAGSGMLVLKSGTKEPLRCRAQNVLATADNLQQALRCASDSYKFEVNAFIVHDNGAISGRWDEQTQSVGGRLTGRINNGQIVAVLDGVGFTAQFEMAISATRQSVKVVPNGDYDIREVVINLQK